MGLNILICRADILGKDTWAIDIGSRARGWTRFANSKRIDHTDINLNPSFTSLFLTDYVMPVSDLDLGFLAQMLQPIMLLSKARQKGHVISLGHAARGHN